MQKSPKNTDEHSIYLENDDDLDKAYGTQRGSQKEENVNLEKKEGGELEIQTLDQHETKLSKKKVHGK